MSVELLDDSRRFVLSPVAWWTTSKDLWRRDGSEPFLKANRPCDRLFRSRRCQRGEQ